MVRVCEKGSMCVGISRTIFCKMGVIQSVPCLQTTVEIFFLISWACNFWMVGVMRETF